MLKAYFTSLTPVADVATIEKEFAGTSRRQPTNEGFSLWLDTNDWNDAMDQADSIAFSLENVEVVEISDQ